MLVSMSATPERPKITDDLLELFASGVDMYIATRSADRMPESVLAMGVRVHRDRRAVTVYVPKELAALTLANLQDNGRAAVTLSHAPTHRTVQLKGRCVGVRDSTENDREIQEIYRASLAATLAVVGVPAALTRGVPWWPSVAVEVEVGDVYTQTPGPNAGERLPD